jgi:hypothetical protein
MYLHKHYQHCLAADQRGVLCDVNEMNAIMRSTHKDVGDKRAASRSQEDQ